MPIIQEGQQARQKALIERAAVALDRIRAKGMIYSPAHGDTAFTCRSLTVSCSESCRLREQRITASSNAFVTFERKRKSERYRVIV